MITDLKFEHGNRFLFERILQCPTAIVGGFQMRVVTNEHEDKKNPAIALEFEVLLETGVARRAVVVLDYRTFSALAQQLDRLYAEYPGRH